MDITLQKVDPTTFQPIKTLVKPSVDEGYTFIQRLCDEYESGVNRFDDQGAILFGVYAGEEIIGVGGVQIDPYLKQPTIGRIQHVYIFPAYRRVGAGRQLMHALIDHACAHFEMLTLRTLTDHGDAFYTSLGFSREPRFNDATHWLALS